MSKVFTFGRMVVDKRHQFFGKPNPQVFVIADMWSDEDDDENIMVDHYRGHYRISFDDLKNTDWYQPLGMIDLTSNLTAHEQCKIAEEEYNHDQ